MTDYQSVFSDSFGRILRAQGVGEEFFADFYDRFISSSPEVAEKFQDTDLVKQRTMLKESFYHMLSFSVSTGVPDALARIAGTHDRDHHDIRPDLYDLWLDCLIGTAAKHDPQFSDDVELAWRLTMAKGIAYMKFEHDH